jgi:hypothetical protein
MVAPAIAAAIFIKAAAPPMLLHARPNRHPQIGGWIESANLKTVSGLRLIEIVTTIIGEFSVSGTLKIAMGKRPTRHSKTCRVYAVSPRSRGRVLVSSLRSLGSRRILALRGLARMKSANHFGDSGPGRFQCGIPWAAILRWATRHRGRGVAHQCWPRWST